MPIRILVVDDHRMVLQSLVRLLTEQDDMSVVATAGTAAEALAAARRERPDVVIMDYVLPDTNGLEATALIRSELPETRVVLLTGDTAENVLLAAIDAECAGYVEKTNAFEELAVAVRAVHAGQAVLPAARLLSGLRRRSAAPSTELTQRELDVLRLLAEGRSNKDIAQQLGLALNTIRNHVQSCLMKLGAHSKLEAVAVASRRSLLRVPRQGSN